MTRNRVKCLTDGGRAGGKRRRMPACAGWIFDSAIMVSPNSKFFLTNLKFELRWGLLNLKWEMSVFLCSFLSYKGGTGQHSFEHFPNNLKVSPRIGLSLIFAWSGNSCSEFPRLIHGGFFAVCHRMTPTMLTFYLSFPSSAAHDASPQAQDHHTLRTFYRHAFFSLSALFVLHSQLSSSFCFSRIFKRFDTSFQSRDTESEISSNRIHF